MRVADAANRRTQEGIAVKYLRKAFARAREEAAQHMTEYAIVMAAIAVVAIVSYRSLGNAISSVVSNVVSQL